MKDETPDQLRFIKVLMGIRQIVRIADFVTCVGYTDDSDKCPDQSGQKPLLILTKYRILLIILTP